MLASPLFAQKEYGFDNRKPSGQDYLSPEESVKRMKVLDGWEVKLFAAEPDVVNPIAFTIDERGRVWVVECFEYPKRTPKDRMPTDRIKILEDTDGDGKCDKVTLWADGKDFPVRFDMASGLEVGHGGAFLGAPPHLFFLRDTDGDGKCDKHEILLSGFGSQDTHETLNTFQWGPDGRLYGLHGVYTQSEVQGVKVNAAVWRYAPALAPLGRGEGVRGNFEVFSEGTSNPWGMDFDSNGQCFLTCCVIPHLFHMVPGATYIKQGNGPSFNPYAYGQLKEICDHTHHKESGWAHAGMIYLDGDHVPEELRGSLIMGSIHGCCIKRDTLRRNGSTFVAGHAEDFLVSGDKNFRPINLRWGPDGSIYVIDWHDQNPCHQAAPDSWDKTRGRIYRIQRKGTKNTPPGDLARKSDAELVALLKNDNPWWHRTALRLLSERRGKVGEGQLRQLYKMALLPGTEPLNLRALWALECAGAFDETFAQDALKHENPWVRAWAVRFVGESEKVSDKMALQLAALAKSEKTPEVRLQLASTAQRLPKESALPLLHNLMERKEDAADPVIPLLLWLALEPKLSQANPELNWLKEHAPGNALVTNDIVPRAMRRLIATGKPEDLVACVQFLGDVKDKEVRRQALKGMTEGLKNRIVDPPADWNRVYADLLKEQDQEIHRLARQLAVNFQDVKALQRSLAVVGDGTKSKSERLDAIRDLALAHPPEALKPLLDVLAKEKDEDLRKSAARALSSFDTKEIPAAILANWKDYPPSVRVECVNCLKGRKEWARELLNALGKGQVPRTDVTNDAILAIRSFNDRELNDLIEKVWGRIRSGTPEELDKLLAQMRSFMHEGRGDLERGRKVFEKNCLQCHRFEGKGHNVGPELDGAERSIEYLLINVLDPNRVIGQPYFKRTVFLKNGQLVTGLLAAEDGQSVTIKRENDALEVFQKKDIEELKTEEKSVMPEGLDKNISPPEFRDLVRYVMAHPFLTEVHVSEAIAAPPTGFDTVHAPEKGLPLKADGIKWLAPVIGPAGRIPLRAAAAAGDKPHALQYVYAEFTAPAAMKTKLLLGVNGRVKVWLNGKLIQTVQGRAGDANPDQETIDIALEAGNNKLLFKISSEEKSPALYVRLLDPERKLTYALSE